MATENIMEAEGTRRIVPRQDLEGSLGSGEKRWEKAYVGNVGNAYDTVADMIADLELVKGSTVVTKGYHAINDGGHGFYNIREKEVFDVNDGGSIIFLDNGKVAELIVDDTINVKQFGAKGDGVTDDTNAFRNAFLVDKLYIPAGNYKLTAPVFGLNEVICDGTFTDMTPFFKTPRFLDTLQAIGKVHDFSPADARKMYAECMTYDTKREKIIISFYWFNSPEKNVFLVLNKDTYAIEQTIDAPYTYPFNALSYNAQNDTIYASGGNTAYVFDAGDLTSYTTFTIPDGKSHIAHDNLTNTDLVISRSDGRITVDVYPNGDYSTKLHTVTSNAGIVEDAAWQDVCAYNGKVYCCSWTGLYEVDVATGDVYKLGTTEEHEIEGFTFVDDVFYIVAHVGNSGWTESIYAYTPSAKPKPSNEFYNDAVSLSIDVKLYDFLATGKYYVSTTDPTTNDYPNGETKGYLVVLNSFTPDDTYVARQIFYSTTAPYEVYCREFTRSNTTWTAWKQLSNFNRALGSVIKSGTISATGDITNIDVSAYKTVLLTFEGNLYNKQSYLIPVHSDFWFDCYIFGNSQTNARICGHLITLEKTLAINTITLAGWTEILYEIRGVEKA